VALVFIVTSLWSSLVTRYALVRLIALQNLCDRAHYEQATQQRTNREKQNHMIINQLNIITSCLLATWLNVFLSYANAINASNFDTYIIFIVNHILTFIPLNSMIDILVIKVIQKPMDINYPNKII
jgi:regulatory protein YycH of two-component signal transduction system YycFG